VLSLITLFTNVFADDIELNIYVSPSGNDSNPGTKELPLASFNGAKNHVRQIKSSTTGNIVVLFRSGIYYLDETVVFGLEDSGEGGQTISYMAYPGETPVFSSGKEIIGWEKVSGQLPGLPEVARGQIFVAETSDCFFTLYDNQGLLPRARSEGFFPEGESSRNKIQFPEGRLKNWSNVEDVEILVRPHHAWIMNILPLASVDEESNTATTSLNATYAINKLHFIKDLENCWVENVLEELDEPGEWVLNTKEGKVYLWPRSESKVVAPTLNELIRVEGEIDFDGPADVPVRNLRFSGLTFKHAKRYQQLNDDKGLQHDWDMLDKDNAVIRLRGTENCVIEKCHFLHSGSGAIRVDLHGKGNRISGNHIEHIGGCGILLCGYGPGTKNVNKQNTVFNNHIHHVGEIYWHSPGIFLWQSGETRVANNLIHHTDYTALIVSGCMSHFFMKGDGRELTRTIRWHELAHLPKEVSRQDVLPYLHTRDNVIEYNEIHHSMLRLGDGNAIYIRGAGEGNIIRRNYIHHMVGKTQMQAAIRTDGGQTGTLITENLIYKCTSQGILTKLNNSVENNIVADIIAPPRGYYLSVREGLLTGASIQRNIFYASSETVEFINELPPGKTGSTEDRRGRKLALVKDANTDNNIYFCKANPEKGKVFLEKNKKDGVDLNSLAVDPLFVDPENGDFRFKPGSPALEMGFTPFDISKVGLRQIEPNWQSLKENYDVPEWFVDGKIGVWMHWGIPSATGEDRPNDGSWYGRNMYGGGDKRSQELSAWHAERYGPPAEFGYEKLIPHFKAENWDPDSLVAFVKDNGARFIMPVACHHDNFDLYDSFHPWNSVDMGPKRDVLREWKEAATKHGLKFGISTHLYWSPGWWRPARKYQKEGTLEWKLFNMDYDPDNFSRQDSWNEHWYARCWEIIDKYDPDMFNNDSPYPKVGPGKGLGVKLFTEYINRDLKENDGEQTVVLSLKDKTIDRAAFTYNLERGSADDIKPEPWIWATDLSGGWFYRKNAVNRMSIPVMVGNAVDAISKNGIVMLNVALRGDGTLPENQAAYLIAFGNFLKINGEGIYGSRPWLSFGEGQLKMKDGRQGENHQDFSQEDIRFTTKGGVLYAFVLAPPTNDIVIKTLAEGGLLDAEIESIELMGSTQKVKWKRSAEGLTIKLPEALPGSIVNGFRITTTDSGK